MPSLLTCRFRTRSTLFATMIIGRSLYCSFLTYCRYLMATSNVVLSWTENTTIYASTGNLSSYTNTNKTHINTKSIWLLLLMHRKIELRQVWLVDWLMVGKFVDTKWVTRKLKIESTNPLKTGRELMCFEKVSSSWSTGGTHRVALVNIQEWVMTGAGLWLSQWRIVMKQIFRNVKTSL